MSDGKRHQSQIMSPYLVHFKIDRKWRVRKLFLDFLTHATHKKNPKWVTKQNYFYIKKKNNRHKRYFSLYFASVTTNLYTYDKTKRWDYYVYKITFLHFYIFVFLLFFSFPFFSSFDSL